MIGRTLGLALLLAGCSGPAATNTQVVDNAVDVELNLTDAADDRADRLDERAGALADQANAKAGAAGTALRNEAAADLTEAARIRAEGQAAGEAAEDRIEGRAGLVNDAGR